jgi:hypothetical protein
VYVHDDEEGKPLDPDAAVATSEQDSSRASEEKSAVVPRRPEVQRELRALASSPGVQALWKSVLPLLGVLPARAGEYPGIFQVEAGPAADEATVYVDIPDGPYVDGEPSDMARVLALTVRLAHDYRRLGHRYYCVDCERPSDEHAH